MVPEVDEMIRDIVVGYGLELRVSASPRVEDGCIIETTVADGQVYRAEGVDFETVLANVWANVRTRG